MAKLLLHFRKSGSPNLMAAQRNTIQCNLSMVYTKVTSDRKTVTVQRTHAFKQKSFQFSLESVDAHYILSFTGKSVPFRR